MQNVQCVRLISVLRFLISARSVGGNAGRTSTIPSLNKPSQSDLEYHHRKLDLAKELWNKTQAQLQDQAKKQADNERELAALRKQLAEKDKDKAVAERQAAEARYQIKALEKDNASLKKSLKKPKS